MKHQRFSILGLEPDPRRAANLKRLVREHVDNADIVVATSSDAAIATLSSKVPDLVLTSALLSPEDDARFMSHLKQLDDAHAVGVLTVPPVVDDEPPRKTRSGALAFFKRAVRWQSFDRAVVSERITDALNQSRSQKSQEIARREPDHQADPSPATKDLELRPTILRRTERARRRRAHRWTLDDLGWLNGIQTPWGLELRTLNISATGLLVESSSKLMPDSSTDLRFYGSQTSVVVPVRVVRSWVADVNGRGVKYQAALVFARKFDLVPERPNSRAASTATPGALAELLMKVTTELGRSRRPEVLRSIYEVGLQQLVTAREVKIRRAPMAPLDGSEAIYFSVPTTDNSPAVLQATFEPDYEPADEEFRLLKAAAMVAGAVLQYESASVPRLPALLTE
jgi:CheY-like chemotaxis protein